MPASRKIRRLHRLPASPQQRWAYGLCLVLIAGNALAAEKEGPSTLAVVSVTGSSIKRIAAEGGLPVQTFSRQDIEQSGAISTADFLQQLPSVQGSFSPAQGSPTISLRNLGAAHTLVLLNGRRLANSGQFSITGGGDVTDLDSLPLAAIDHIEILSDGASALYGSDAIAGVVNLITRSNFEAFEVDARVMHPQHGGLNQQRYSLTKGFGQLQNDGYNLLLAVSHDEGQALMASERGFSRSGFIRFNEAGKDYLFANPLPFSAPASLSIGNLSRDPYSAGVTPYSAATAGRCASGQRLDPRGGGYCVFDAAASIALYPQTRRDNLLLGFNKTLNSAHTLFVDLLHTRSDILPQAFPLPMMVPVSSNSPYYGSAAALGASGDVLTRWAGIDVGPLRPLLASEATHLALGSKGMLGAWDYQLAYVHSSNQARLDYLGGYLTSNSLQGLLSSQAINPFLTPGSQTPATQAALHAAQYRGNYQVGETRLDSLGFNASRPVFSMGGGEAMLGLGVDFKREQLDLAPSAIAQGLGDTLLGDLGNARAFKLSRPVWGAFAELMLPVHRELEATLAVRHDQYGGSTGFGGTTNGKLSARWQPSQQWLWRASAGSGFKAPTVAMMAPMQQLARFSSGSIACPFAASSPSAAYCDPAGNLVQILVQGNPELKPETSQQLSLGTRFEPTSNLSLGADWWLIRLKDRFGQAGEASVFANPSAFPEIAAGATATGPAFTLWNDPVSGARSLALILPNANMGRQNVAGIDFDLSGRQATPLGKLHSQLIATRFTRSDYELVAGGGYRSNLGTYQDGSVTQRWRVRWRNTLEQAPFTHTLTLSFIDGYRDQSQSAASCSVTRVSDGACVDLQRDVAAQFRVDFQTQYVWNPALRLMVGVLNLFDRMPPLSLQTNAGLQTGYDPRYADPRGRTFYASLNYRF